jgi:hypothetical protein
LLLNFLAPLGIIFFIVSALCPFDVGKNFIQSPAAAKTKDGSKTIFILGSVLLLFSILISWIFPPSQSAAFATEYELQNIATNTMAMHLENIISPHFLSDWVPFSKTAD